MIKLNAIFVIILLAFSKLPAKPATCVRNSLAIRRAKEGDAFPNVSFRLFRKPNVKPGTGVSLVALSVRPEDAF
jgi:hypothetical protein